MAEVPAKLALPAPRAEHISLLVARTAALIVCAMGGVVLLGWQIPDPELSQALPGLASMTPHAALGVLAAGIGLFCFTFRALRPLARIIGFALVVLGLAVMTDRKSVV